MEQQLTIGKRIAMLRKNAGLTQEQLGEKVGVSAQAVSKWENDLACPDISALPLLADIFGITTDELLGIKPIEPHVVIIDKDKDSDSNDDNSHSFEIKYEKISHWSGISICITAIIICVTLILKSNTSLFNSGNQNTWNYIWPVLVFGFGLMNIRKYPVLGITALLLGIYEYIWFGWGVPFEIKWYVILLIIAVGFLVRILLEQAGVLKKSRDFNIVNQSSVSEYSTDDYIINADLNFGSRHIVYENDILRGMNIETNFGNHEFDLTNVKTFLNDPIINVEVNFSNVVIILPGNVRLFKNSETSFAAMSIKGDPDKDADQTVYLKGEVNFGHLEIRYPN